MKLARTPRLIDRGTIQPLGPVEAAELKSPGRDDDPNGAWRGESLDTLPFVPSRPRRDLPQLGPRIEMSQSRRWIKAAGEASGTTYFGCVAGTGLDAAISRQTMKHPRWLRSHGGYVLALVETLVRFQPPQVTLSLEIDGDWQAPIREPGMLIALGNGPGYGSGMGLAHRAELDDGLLDVCFVRKLNKLRLLRLFPAVFLGMHIGMKQVEYWKVTRVRIQTNPVLEIFADANMPARHLWNLACSRMACG